MVGRYEFVIGRFRADLKEHLKDSSVREISDNINGEISYPTIARLANGTASDVKISTLMLVATAIGKNPCDYIDRLMF